MSTHQLYKMDGHVASVNDELIKPYFSRQTELSVQNGCILLGNKLVIPKAG